MRKMLLLFALLAVVQLINAQHKKKSGTKKSTKQRNKKQPNNVGIASYYSDVLHGSKTATGEIFDNNKLTGASNQFKLQSWVRVINLSNDKAVVVRINDRMHRRMVRRGRIIDVSKAAAEQLDFLKKGLVKVRVEPVDAPPLTQDSIKKL